MFDVSFQPGVLSKFIRLPLGEFVNQNIEAEAVLSSEIHQINERLANAGSYQQMTDLVEAWLWQRIQQLKIDLSPMEKISRVVLATIAPMSLDAWAADSCLIISAFERRFRHKMGVSPKLFARIIRFDRAMQRHQTNPGLDWLSVVIQAGYTDALSQRLQAVRWRYARWLCAVKCQCSGAVAGTGVNKQPNCKTPILYQHRAPPIAQFCRVSLP